MKYYMYISEPKVLSLSAQIPKKARGKETAEAGLNIGIAKATLKTEKTPPVEELEGKLSKLIDYLKSKDDVGTLDDPRAWIADTVDARLVLMRDDQTVVFFLGETQSGAVFGLGGSRHNLTTEGKPEGVGIGWSFLPFLLRTLRSHVEAPDDEISAQLFRASSEPHKDEWIQFLLDAEDSPLDPPIRVEFFARTLLVGQDPNTSKTGILATPLYVAAT